MTHYDKLIDSIVEEIYLLWSENTTNWDENEAKIKAHSILKWQKNFKQLVLKLPHNGEHLTDGII